nr:hypothetical protein [Tanacetum cinerariifolium]
MVYQRPLLGLVPKGRLLHDLEALRRHERIREAESKTSRTEDHATKTYVGSTGAGGSGRASGSGGAGGSGCTGGNADGTGVRGAEPTVPELTGTKAMGIKAANNTLGAR